MGKAPESVEQRNEEIIRLDGQGLSLTAIAKQMRLSRGGVYGVLVKHRGRRKNQASSTARTNKE